MSSEDPEYKRKCREAQALADGLDATQVLRALLVEFSIDDYIYDVRERELEGWEGPKVVRYGALVTRARALVEGS